jgi:hypothetical protein
MRLYLFLPETPADPIEMKRKEVIEQQKTERKTFHSMGKDTTIEESIFYYYTSHNFTHAHTKH